MSLSIILEEIKKTFFLDAETGNLFWKDWHGRWKRIPPVPAVCVGPNGYLIVEFKGKTRFVHCLIWAIANNSLVPDGMEVDHIDRNKSNNRPSNLRLANQSDQMCNRGKQKSNKSGEPGVHWDTRRRKWMTQVMRHNSFVLHRRFDKFEEAVAAVRAARIQHHGEFASDYS